jgi:PAS domain S-box-containing protein
VQADRRHEAERERLAQMFEQAPGFICPMSGPDHVFEFVNAAHRRLFNSAAWIGKPLREAFPDIEGQGFYEAMDQVYATGERRVYSRMPTTFRAGPGGEMRMRLLDFVYAPMLDDHGVVSGIFCEGYDVTDQGLAERALQDSQERLQLALDAADMGTFVWYPQEDRTEADAQMMALFGLPGDGLLSLASALADSILPEDGVRYGEAVARACDPRGPGELRQDIRVRRLNGSVRWLGVTAQVYFEDGKATRMAGAAVDITDRKLTEAALRESEARLEQRVEERTEQLLKAQAALHQSQKMETVGQLTGGVAHDFNNLLMPIVGALDMLRGRLAGDERAQRLTNAGLQAADRAQTLVQRLLAFSRRQHLSPRAVDVRSLIESMADLVSRSLGPRIRLVLEITPDLPPAHVDPNQLELALLNLAVNARDAMGGEGILTVRALPAAEGDILGGSSAFVQIAVTDTGVGMDAETLKRAVEPFFTTKGVGRGTGLGLSSVQGLAEQSGGSFRLTSTPGRGTTAALWLPVSSEAPAAPLIMRGAPVEGGPHKARHGVILLVDDEDLVRAGAADMLTEAGYTVEEANSGYRAVQLLKGGLRPDVVVTDYAMPGMSGAELAREVRKTVPGVPVLMITGYATLTDREAGDLPRLAKPFRQADLVAAVEEIMQTARAPAAG